MTEYKPIIREGIASATQGSVQTETLEAYQPTVVETDWIYGATLWLLNSSVHQFIPSEEYVFRNLYESRRPVDDVKPELQEMSRIHVKSTESMVGEHQSFKDREEFVQRLDENSGIVAFGSRGEGFWNSLGSMEIGKQGYIVFPEFLASGIVGVARPDGVAYQLGKHQEILSELGFIPGGATLPEIALRSCFDERSSTKESPETRVTVIEAKPEERGADGRRELVSHRQGNKRPYLDGGPVDGGWLICPRDQGRMSKLEKIGGITWDEEGPEVIEAPISSDVDTAAQERAVREAMTLVLDQVLRYQPLEEPLAQAVRDCLDNPERLYHYL